MKSLENYDLLKRKLDGRNVLDSVETVMDCDLLNKSKYTLIAICHQMIHDLVEGDLKDELLFPFITVTSTRIGTGMLNEEEIEEADRTKLPKDTKLISVYDYIKHIGH